MFPLPPTIKPLDLRCESVANPLGIGRVKPILSWKLHATKVGLQNLRQSAYRVLAASDPNLLRVGKANLWDSKRVVSNAQYGIEYAGKPLRSGQVVWWMVQTWDQAGVPSVWSPRARFSTGLLKPSDWTAKWIGYDVPDDPFSSARPLGGASWIWSEKDKPGDVGSVIRTFVRRFEIGESMREARITLTADDQFTLFVNGEEVGRSSGKTDAWKTAVSIDLAKYLKIGSNEIAVEAKNSEKGSAGMIAKIILKGSKETTLIVSDASWKERDGASIQVLGSYSTGPWGRFGEGTPLYPSVLYRKDFTAKPKLKRAMAYVTAMGLVDLHLNGKRVSEDLFSPGWTNYDKRVYAKAYDVTALIKSGANTVGAEVGDGWYAGYVSNTGRAHYGERPRVRVQLNLEYTDGRKESIGTSEDWRASVGARTAQDFQMGEEYDARLATPFATSGFPASKWIKSKVVTGIKAQIDPWIGVPVRPYQRLKAISIKRQGDGYLIDYGQNLAGFASLKMQGRAGQKVTLKFVESLNPDGTPYTINLRTARAMDAYTFKGGGVEEWSPRFTFHGFRYVKVTGLLKAPKPDEIVAVAISSATPETGSIQTSDPMLNKLAKNAWWTQKMNFIDIPTDCPQRDERLGWTGDAQAYIRTAATYSDVQAFFDKWLVTLEDEQSSNGDFPPYAPATGSSDGGPAWADAGVICPWTIFDVYGDKRLLAERYESMRRYVDFTVKRSTSELLPPQRFNCFGDWLSINANTPNDVIYEAYFAGSARLMARAARALGKTADAEKYERLYSDVRAAFCKAYVSPEGVVKGNTQTSYILALGFDLLDKPAAIKAAARLVANIESRKWHLSTGFVGTRDLMQVLSKIGRDDVAFRLLHNKTFPSWGFEIVNGATTVWERWDGWTPEKGFQDPGMNSFAHYAYGAVMGWVFATIGGIDNASPGFEKIAIAPKIDPNLTWAKTSYDSVRGTVKTEWQRRGKRIDLTVEIPPNATAEVRVPGGKVVTVGSGTYRFVGTTL